MTNTANMLQLNNAIQAKTDHLYNIELKRNEIKIALRNNEIIDEVQAEQILNEKENAILSLLNTYEFACQHYLDFKIDRKAFKTFYNEMIKYIREKDEYSFLYEIKGGKEPFSAINKVYRKWYLK